MGTSNKIWTLILALFFFLIVLRWCFRKAWNRFWKLRHKSLGLADPEQLQNWTAADFDREFAYAHRRYDDARGENQKQERGLDILGLIEAARHCGFVQRREGDSFDTLHFVKIDQQAGTSEPLLKDEKL